MLVGKESECEGGCALEGDLGGSRVGASEN